MPDKTRRTLRGGGYPAGSTEISKLAPPKKGQPGAGASPKAKDDKAGGGGTEGK